jgi:hypothetical protein
MFLSYEQQEQKQDYLFALNEMKKRLLLFPFGFQGPGGGGGVLLGPFFGQSAGFLKIVSLILSVVGR